MLFPFLISAFFTSEEKYGSVSDFVDRHPFVKTYPEYKYPGISLKGQTVVWASDDKQSRNNLTHFVEQTLSRQGLELTNLFTMSGGAIQENWKLEFNTPEGDKLECVLRTDAKTKIPGSLGKSDEYGFLKLASDAGVKVPRPFALCTDNSVIGQPFILMDYLYGTTDYEEILSLNIGEKLGFQLGAQLAKIHQIKPSQGQNQSTLETADKESPAYQKITYYRDFFDRREVNNIPAEWAMRWCLSWLKIFPKIDLTLTHGDFRSANYLADQNGLIGLLDWEFSEWGDPYSDLGWFCAKCWRYGREQTPAGGISTRKSFYKGYSSVSKAEIDSQRVLFWEVMALLRWLVIAIQQGDRNFIEGERDLELGLTGIVRPAEIEHMLLELTGPDSWPKIPDGR